MINKQDSRHLIKRSTLTGVVPTVPPSSDFTDGTWLNTDTRIGEFFYNIPDEKLWIGTNSGFLELTGAFALTLSDVLSNGNTTGANDISINTGQGIFSGNGNGQLLLDAFNTAGDIMLMNGATPYSGDMIYQSLSQGTTIWNSVMAERANIVLYNGSIIIGVTHNVGGSSQFPNGIEIIATGSVTASSSILGTGLAGVFINSLNSNIALGTSYNVVAGYQQNIVAGDNNFLMGMSNTNSAGNYSLITGVINHNNANASIIGGKVNMNNASASFISGSTNQNNGINSIIYGAGNINNAQNNILGGSTNTANADLSILVGRLHTMNNPGVMYGRVVASATVDIASGLSSVGISTTNATPTVLLKDGTNAFTVEPNTAYRVNLTLLARSSTGNCKEWTGYGIIKNVGGTTSLVGAGITLTSTLADASLATATVAVTANNTTDTLDVTVTGIAATTISWNCGIQYEKLS